MMLNNNGRLILILAFSIIFGICIVSADPNGAEISPGTPMRGSTSPAGNDSAFAGNITELIIRADSITQTWQGYFGNISGVIELSDSSGRAMYNWSIAEPGGEIYASTNSSISWGNIQCFNFTALGNYTSESDNGGTTNLYGLNLTQLETRYGVTLSDADGVNDTFGEFNHNQFYTANKDFAVNECRSAQIYDNSGKSTDGNFEEILLYEPVSTSVVFTALLEEGTLNGFDGADHDFEMIVLENGHNADVSATPYYFFVEIE